MSTRMQQRRGTAAQWISTNSGNGPILAAGEIGFESDTNKFKIGDGINHWVDLTYFTDAAELSNIIDGAPALLDTLNELAAAIGDDPAFVTTVATNLSNHQSDTTNIHGITDTAELATKSFAASLLTGATKSNITITGDKNGLTITAENGVADSTTDNLTEGSTNKYFTDERAQDAIGLNLGTGLAYNDSTGAISLNTSTTNVSEGANLYFTDERAQDAVGNSVGTGLSYDDASGAISVNTSTIQARVSGVSDTEIGYLDGVTSAIQTQLNDKAPLASPTFTGTATTNDLIVNGDFTVNGTNFAASATSITIEDNLVQIAHQNPANTVDLGIVVGYNDGTAKHAGLVKDTSENTWKLFKGVTTEPATTVDFTQGSLDDLAVAGLTASSITVGDVSNTEFGYLNGVTSAIQTQLDAKVATSSLASGVATFLETPSSANLRGAVTDETGTGALVFANTPTLVTPALGVATATSINGTTIPSSKTLVVTTDKLSVHAATSSSELAGIISDETGSGALVFGTSPTLKGPFYIQSAGGAGGSNNYITTDNSTGKLSIVSGYPLDLTASGNITLTATGGAARVGSDTIATLTATQTLTGKTINGADNTLTVRLANDVSGTLPIANGGTGATTAANAAAALLPSQSSNSGKYLTTDGAGTLSWGTVTSYSAPTLGSTSIASGATVTTIAGLTLTAPTLTGTVTASGDINLSAAGGPGSVIDEFTLLIMGAL